MTDKSPIDKITILRGTVFGGVVVSPKDVCEVTDINRADAERLILSGKAVAGAVAAAPEGGAEDKPNKMITGADLKKR